jgi:hypothetical protein
LDDDLGHEPLRDLEHLRRRLVDEVGLPPDRVTDDLVVRISEDPLFLHHLDVCGEDPEMLDILLREAGSNATTTHPPPTNKELLKRATISLTRWAASRFSRVSLEEYQRRLSICRSCTHLSTPPTDSPLYRLIGSSPGSRSICGLCGCDVRRKAWLSTESCPDSQENEEGRWAVGQLIGE